MEVRVPKKRILCIPELFIRGFPLNKAILAYIVKTTNAYQLILIQVCAYHAYQNRYIPIAMLVLWGQRVKGLKNAYYAYQDGLYVDSL